ncbi:hypothetical protein ACEWY4_008548 [Coilia grayii]|uniref:Olfactory receptor n=1 Tax=Coilia grayii TaxID=363190 RepID=A0ABD1KB55_9TELE
MRGDISLTRTKSSTGFFMLRTMENSSFHKVFILTGLQQSEKNKSLYFYLTCTLYILIIAMNVTIIITVRVDKALHEPMYIFLSNLCANGLYGTVGFYPKFLIDLLSDVAVISYPQCVTQTYVIYSSAVCEITILTAMAFDRYVAICRPLQYHSIFTSHMVLKLLSLAWFYPASVSVVAIVLTVRVPICGSFISKLFCDIPSILKRGCYQTTVNRIFGIILMMGQVIQVLLICVSYVQIVRVCLRSRAGRRRFTQTCLPHIIALFVSILSLLFDLSCSWADTTNLSLDLRNVLGMQFLILPPICNPLVYGLQLPQIRRAILKTYLKTKVSKNKRNNRRSVIKAIG